MRSGKTVMMLEDAADGVLSALALVIFDIPMGESSIAAVVLASAALSLLYRLSDLNAQGTVAVRGKYIGRLLSSNLVFFTVYPIVLFLFRKRGLSVSIFI